MKITPNIQENKYTFTVELHGKSYNVQIWMNDSSSKFDDWEITDSQGNPTDFDVEDEIIAEIDENWAELVG
jgi:hypothetical protein